MTKFVVDAWAWIEYLDGSEKGKIVARLFEDNPNEFFTSSVTVAEVISKFLRKGKEIGVAVNGINNLSTVVDATQDISLVAGQIHFRVKQVNKNFGMLDSFVAATAKKLGAKILTGDDDFKGFKEAVFI